LSFWSEEKNSSRPSCKVEETCAFERAALRYLEKKYRECVARGKEPPFDLEDMLRHYGPSPPNTEVAAPLSSFALAKNLSEHSTFPRKVG